MAAVSSGLVCKSSFACQDTDQKAKMESTLRVLSSQQDKQKQDEDKKDEDKQDQDKQDQDKQEDEKESLQERIAAVQRLLRNGEDEDALDLLQEIYDDGQQDNLIVAVNFISLMQRIGLQKAQEDRKSGNEMFYKSAKIARRLLEKDDLPARAKNQMSSVIYNEACTYAIDGKNEKALKTLKESLELGFDNFELASTDPDFGDLRETDEFKKIIEDRKKYLAQKKIDDLHKAIADFEPYKFDYELEDVEGKTIKKSDSKGKMLIVDFWGTWCGPCRREVPSFVKLKKKYGDELDIIGIAYEKTEDPTDPWYMYDWLHGGHGVMQTGIG